MTKIFIDRTEGTTRLRIYERISGREDLELILLSDEERKDPAARKKALNSCDIAFLCLPDAAAREAVAMVENPDVTVIDCTDFVSRDQADFGDLWVHPNHIGFGLFFENLKHALEPYL